MIQTVEAVVDVNGQVRLLGTVHVNSPRRALVTVLEEPAAIERLAEATPSGSVVSPQPWEKAWRAWAAGHKTSPAAADDREGIYAGRGE